MGSHQGFDACSTRKRERICVDMASEGRAIQMLKVKRRRGDRVIGLMAILACQRWEDLMLISRQRSVGELVGRKEDQMFRSSGDDQKRNPVFSRRK
jgi:anion-transporting  ArsA/GET3 family ATPase